MKESALSGLELLNIWAALEKLKKYETIGTLEKLREAREKQVPKKPITYPNTNRADCPVCGATVRGIRKPFGNFCDKCGQIELGEIETDHSGAPRAIRIKGTLSNNIGNED